jgi:hypothetical protein
MEQAVHSFWFEHSRRPTWARKTYSDDEARFDTFIKRLTPLQKSRIKHVQVYAQMHWLERSFDFSCLWNSSYYDLPDLSTFTVTIRHSDWHFWEADRTLRLNIRWVRDSLCSPEANSISEFRL